MKNLYFLLLCLVILSCRKDETEEKSLIGLWKPNKTQTISGKDLTTILSDEISNNCEQMSTIEFLNDGSFHLKFYSKNNSNPGTCKNDGTVNGKYTFKKDAMEIILNATGLDNNATYKINELSNNTLIVTYMSDGEDVNGDGVTDRFRTFYSKN